MSAYKQVYFTIYVEYSHLLPIACHTKAWYTPHKFTRKYVFFSPCGIIDAIPADAKPERRAFTFSEQFTA